MKKIIIFAIRFTGLFIFWVLLSGKIDAFHLSIGTASAAVIAYLSIPVRPPEDRPYLQDTIGHLLRFLRYAAWLLTRIILAAIHVSKVVLQPKMPIRPRLIKHKTTLKTDAARVLFGNSITLTPGTITADLSGDMLTVHELDEASSEDIRSGNMERHIRAVFRKETAP